MEQYEIIIDKESMIENRKNVLNMFNGLKSKFLKGSFTMNDLTTYYNYSIQSAQLVLDTLARNGLINGLFNKNINTFEYSFVNDETEQLRNINLWLKRTKQEKIFFELAIEVIENEITEKQTNNLKIIK